MSQLRTWAISRRAMVALLDRTDAREIELPRHWFNWSYRKLGLASSVERLTLMPKDEKEQMAWLEGWYQTARTAGYTPGAVLTIDDDGKIPSSLEELAIYRLLNDIDRSEIEGVVRELSEPEEFFILGWFRLRWGGGIRLLGPQATPAQWRAYGDALQRWFAEPYAPQSLFDRVESFVNWHDNCVQLLPEDFLWPDGTSLQEPESFVCLKFMPCCGVALNAQGEPITVGMLTPGWEWDGSTRIYQELLKYRALVHKRPPESNIPLDLETRTADTRAAHDISSVESDWALAAVAGAFEIARISLSLDNALSIKSDATGTEQVLHGYPPSESLLWSQTVKLPALKPGGKDMILTFRIIKRVDSARKGIGGVYSLSVEDPQSLGSGRVQVAIAMQDKGGKAFTTRPATLSLKHPAYRISVGQIAQFLLVKRLA